MNIWRCEVCNRFVEGVGSAVGLRAIGWFFENGPRILCPEHRPDSVPCDDNAEFRGTDCSLCAAELEAAWYQLHMDPASVSRYVGRKLPTAEYVIPMFGAPATKEPKGDK